uniref:XkdQ/YqbQ family protein n=1 Tax=Aminipila terrae TaxID=2697030 RepID=UPI001FAC4561|nr:hypothetical protein [Aminipila terrae]
MEFLVRVDGEFYEISELITKVTYTDNLNDGCSKLEFSYVNDDLIITNGSVVRFKYGNANIFNGIAFKVTRSDEKEITVTAYDQLRYCKTKDSIVINGETATDIIKRMCNYLGLHIGSLTNTGYILPVSVQDDKTWLDIIYNALSDTLVGTGKKYALRDEFGLITFRNLDSLKSNLILGDKSLCYDFNYEKSIDDDFYNQIKLYIKGDTASTSQFVGPKMKNQ